MNNLLPTKVRIHEKYDLKGTNHNGGFGHWVHYLYFLLSKCNYYQNSSSTYSRRLVCVMLWPRQRHCLVVGDWVSNAKGVARRDNRERTACDLQAARSSARRAARSCTSRCPPWRTTTSRVSTRAASRSSTRRTPRCSTRSGATRSYVPASASLLNWQYCVRPFRLSSLLTCSVLLFALGHSALMSCELCLVVSVWGEIASTNDCDQWPVISAVGDQWPLITGRVQ